MNISKRHIAQHQSEYARHNPQVRREIDASKRRETGCRQTIPVYSTDTLCPITWIQVPIFANICEYSYANANSRTRSYSKTKCTRDRREVRIFLEFIFVRTIYILLPETTRDGIFFAFILGTWYIFEYIFG